jgi:phage/plasmid-associated DNA primase
MYTFTNTAKFIVSANRNLPAIKNEKEYQRRFVLLHAGAPSLEDIPNGDDIKHKFAEEKLFAEIPAFASYAISQARKALEAKRLTILPATKARTNDWLAGGDYAKKFVDSFIVETVGTYGVPFPYLFERYNEYLQEETDATVGKIAFREEMKKNGVTFEPAPRKAKEIDTYVVPDWHKNARNRAIGKGYKSE